MYSKDSTTPSTINTESTIWAFHEEILSARAISREYAEKVGLQSVDLGTQKDFQAKYKLRGAWANLPLHRTTGILIPYHECLDGILRFRVRSDKTEYVQHQGDTHHEPGTTVKVPRYICQYGVRVAPYMTPEALAAAGDTTVPLYLVEAPLKAMALACNGFPAIGLGGVLAGAHDPDILKDAEEVVASKELKRINWRGRRVYIAFDAFLDRNPHVALGAAYAAIALEREGADVWVVSLPPFHPEEADIEAGHMWSETDQGPDDYLARNGKEAFQALVDAAVPAKPAARITHETRGVDRRAARAEIIGRLTEELLFQAMLHRGGDLAVDLAAGVGKSSDISKKTFSKAAACFGEALSKRQAEEEPDWKSELRTTSSGVVKPVAFNVEIALRNDSKLKGLVAYDEFKQCPVFRTQPPWTAEYPDSKNTKVGDPWADVDDTRLAGYLTREHDIVDLAEKKTQAALTVVAMDHRFHPVREYLHGLTWDGTPRIDNMMETYFAADPTLREYLQIVSRVWMIAAVARVERPGCKADLMLVLEGDQSVKKTSAFRVLGGDWYSDATQDDLQNKEAAMKLQGSWIFVFDEGSILSKADARHLKEFVTKEEDEIIPKYSNRKMLFKRQCVLGLTTNDHQYLSDPTGNRRYMPVMCGMTSPKIDLDALRRDRDQLWAEAYARFQAGVQWWPTDEEEKLLAVEQDKRRRQDTWEPLIEEGIANLNETTVEDILTNVIKIEAKHADQQDRVRVSNALKVFGWKLEIRKVGGVTKRIYVRPSKAEAPLVPTRKLTQAQEEALAAFRKVFPCDVTLERTASGTVIRMLREIEPRAGDAFDTMTEDVMAMV